MIYTNRRPWKFVRPSLMRFRRDEDGTVAIVTGAGLTMLVGFAALAVDVASWQSAKRSIQGAADMAAYSAAIASQKNNGSGTTTEAKATAASMGYAETNGVTVSVNQPPTSGSYTGNASAIEVKISQPQPRFFSGIFSSVSANPTLTAQAVALISTGGSACILALSTSANQAINVSGSANIHAPNCDVVSNSTSSSAINMSGGAAIDARCLVAVGQVQTTSGLTEQKCTTPKINASSTADPYASLAAPTASGPCTNPLGPNFSPGHYCSLVVSFPATTPVTFQPGTYYVDGNFAIQGSSKATGSGVTFYLAGTNNAISGSAVVNLSAPTSGTYAGMLFFADRSINNATNNFSGGTGLSLTGALYFPTQDFSFTGGTSTTNSCLQIVVKTLTVSGTAYLGDSGCSGTGVANISVNDGTAGAVKLVE